MKNLGIKALDKEFESVLDDNERILWAGKPHFLIFMSTGVPFLILGLLWGLFDYEIFRKAQWGAPISIVFLLLHAAPFYLSILNIFRLLLVFSNTCYAVTDRRLLLRGGFLGIDYKSVEYEKVQDLEVNVNPIEQILGNLGTIRARTATISARGPAVVHKFVGISSPYELFKRIREASERSKENHFVV